MAKPQAKIKRAVNDELGYAKLRVPSGHPFFGAYRLESSLYAHAGLLP